MTDELPPGVPSKIIAAWVDEAELPPGETIAGLSSQMRKPALWLEAEDVLEAGGRIEAMIARVVRYPLVTFADGSEEENLHAIHWHADSMKPLLLNKTNRVQLIDAWGKHVTGWMGRRVVLFTVRTKNPKTNEPCRGTRLRPILDRPSRTMSRFNPRDPA
jgi:hypothetical protein